MKRKVTMMTRTETKVKMMTHLIKEEKEDRHEEKGDDDDTHLIKEEKEDRHEEKGEDGSGGAERSTEQTTGDYHHRSHNVQSDLDGSFACQ